jgi:hypothetical protein
MESPVVFEVVLSDGETQVVREANGYVQEGPLTTVFSSPRSRAQIDSRSERLGSFRTTEIRRIVRREMEDVGLRAVPDGPDDGYGHFTFGTDAGGRGGQ